FTLGEADVLRAAMGKKDKGKMATQREKFLRGAVGRGVTAETAEQLFDLIAFFAGYGFGAAHAHAYALIGYQTAYLKANYPLEYMCALLNTRADNFDKLKASILDCHAHGLAVRPPDVNRSAAAFSIGDAKQGEILFGLQHIKNVGEKVAEAIVAARSEGGPFTTMLDLALRVGTKELNRRVLEALIRSGACDPLGERTALLALVDRVIDRAAQIRRERESGQTSLFGDSAEALHEAPVIEVMGTPVDSDLGPQSRAATEERLRWEREFLGMYLSDHPLRQVASQLRQRIDTNLSELGPHLEGLVVQVAGIVRDMYTFIPRNSRNGQRMARLQIEDLTGSCEVVVFARTFEEFADLIRQDAIVVVRGNVKAGRSALSSSTSLDEADKAELDVAAEPSEIVAESIFALDDPRLDAWRSNSTVHLRLTREQMRHLDALRNAIQQHPGQCPVILRVDSDGSVDEIALSEDFFVEPGPAFERAVEGLLGDGAYRLSVRRNRVPERETGTAARRR
ncbi:MAG TPA: OB-fold nucleic acid binding domain-containing protein, partial [Candidatus Dormibacteraeota bacterium]|nr:OB-fold nucleic acid binding domain-containing protein [Candidatus Dormibacteraeota bacterium]